LDVFGLYPHDDGRKFGIGTELTVAAERAEPTNCRREICDRFGMLTSSGLHLGETRVAAVADSERTA